MQHLIQGTFIDDDEGEAGRQAGEKVTTYFKIGMNNVEDYVGEYL